MVRYNKMIGCNVPLFLLNECLVFRGVDCDTWTTGGRGVGFFVFAFFCSSMKDSTRVLSSSVSEESSSLVSGRHLKLSGDLSPMGEAFSDIEI